MKQIVTVVVLLLFGLRVSGQYNNAIQKIDFYSGSTSNMAWSLALLNFLEQRDFKSIKENFNIDSTQILEESHYINQNFKWPEEVRPGWLHLEENKEHYVRTYFERFGDTYKYEYQIEISFDKDDFPNITFRKEEEVIEMDEILNSYFKRIDNMIDKDFDPENPCQKMVVPEEQWLMNAEKFKKIGDSENAIINYNKYLWKNPENTEALISKVFLLTSQQKKLDEAMEACNKLISLNENDPSYYLYRANVNIMKKDYSQAIEDCKLSQTPYYKEIISDIYSFQNKNEEALKVLEGLEKSERSQDYYLRKVGLFKKMGRISEFEASLDSVMIQSENEIYRYRAVASGLFNLGIYDKSVYFHKKSLSVYHKTGNNKNTILLDLSEALITNSQFLESQEITDRLLQIVDLPVRDKIVYLYLNIIARSLAKDTYVYQQAILDELILKETVDEKGTWNFTPFLVWLDESQNITKEDKVFVNSIIEKVKKVL